MKEKKPGDHIILRLKNTESPVILDWINRQSNLSDAIRYLIEEEIKTNAVRNLQEYIPAKRRTVPAEAGQVAATEESYVQQPVPSYQTTGEPEPEQEDEQEEDAYTEEVIDSWMNI